MVQFTWDGSRHMRHIFRFTESIWFSPTPAITGEIMQLQSGSPHLVLDIQLSYRKETTCGCRRRIIPWYTCLVRSTSQGSILGPLLFLIYIDDISLINLSEGSVLNLFADDMLLYKPINSTRDFHHLQLDIEQISDWVCRNNLISPQSHKM